MTKTRLEAFSDAVIAIIMTIMVLELRAPKGSDIDSLRPMMPIFLSYLLSFIFLGIYWNNHHHLIHAVQKVNGVVLWANMHLLFWLSLIPFSTAWLGEHGLAPGPVALYGVILLFSGLAYFILSQVLVRVEGEDSKVAIALGKDLKGQVSVLLYCLAIFCAFTVPAVSCAIYVFVALMWLVPDRRLEHH